MAGDTRNSKFRKDTFSLAVIGVVILVVLYSSWELQEASVSHDEKEETHSSFLGGFTGSLRSDTFVRTSSTTGHSSRTIDLGHEAAHSVTEVRAATDTAPAASHTHQDAAPAVSPPPTDTASPPPQGAVPPPPPDAAHKGTMLKTDAYHVNTCYAYPHLDFSGIAVKYGYTNLKDSAGECCDDCQNFVPKADDPNALDCNVWVWCGDKEICGKTYRQCWLKHIAHLQVTSPLGTGPSIGWTVGTKDTIDLRDAFSGLTARNASVTFEEAKESAKQLLEARWEREPTKKTFHTITSFQGRNVEWSMRIHYYWFRKMRAKCRAELGDRCEMGGFTRLLHSGQTDQWCDEIPTLVVDPLSESVVPHRAYVVLNRPYAFVEWLKIVDIPEKYLFMSEPDHIFLHPMPNFMRGDIPAAFPFFYVVATDPKSQPHVKKHTGINTISQLEEVFPMGNSPVWMAMDDIRKIMPVWHNITVNVYKDRAAATEWGWVQEMYGFAMAAWLIGIKEVDLLPHLMAQPPYDTAYEERAKKPFYIIHYTYGLDYNRSGKMLPDKIGEWHFDKRALRKPVSRNMSEPFPKVNSSLVRHLVRAFNEATDAFPCWDKYAETGDKPSVCDEKPKHYLATPEAKLDWQLGDPVQEGQAAKEEGKAVQEGSAGAVTV